MIRSRVYRWGPVAASIGALIAIIVFGTAIAVSFERQDSVDERLCIQTVENRRAIRATWAAARLLVIRGLKDPAAIARTNLFFAEVLRPIPPLKCDGNTPTRRD